jgi:3-dehydroquinate synthase class II
MAQIKKISTELQLLDKFLDTGGSAGTSGQVLVSTATGVDWVDGSGSGIIGGPYLPLAGGTMTGTNGVVLPDNFNLKIGTGSDLQIYHSGTESKINNDVGNLSITNFANDSDIIFSSDNGSGSTTPYLQLDGSHTQSIAWKDIHFVDGIKAKFGDYASPDLQIYHDGSNSYITDSGTGDLIITADNDLTFKDGSGNIMANMNASNSVELMFGNVKKFETTSTGVTVTGDIKIDSALLSNQENTDVDTGAEVVAQVSTSTYTAAFFDFVIKKVGNIRSGTVYACHDGTNVEFTETSTQDLGDTSDVTLSVDKSGTNLRLIATVTSDDWIIKSLIRAI